MQNINFIKRLGVKMEDNRNQKDKNNDDLFFYLKNPFKKICIDYQDGRHLEVENDKFLKYGVRLSFKALSRHERTDRSNDRDEINSMNIFSDDNSSITSITDSSEEDLFLNLPSGMHEKFELKTKNQTTSIVADSVIDEGTIEEKSINVKSETEVDFDVNHDGPAKKKLKYFNEVAHNKSDQDEVWTDHEDEICPPSIANSVYLDMQHHDNKSEKNGGVMEAILDMDEYDEDEDEEEKSPPSLSGSVYRDIKNVDSDTKFWSLINNDEAMLKYLVGKKILIDVDKLNKLNYPCTAPRCQHPNGTWKLLTRKRLATPRLMGGEDVMYVRHSCNTRRSIRGGGFLTWISEKGNCFTKMSIDKILLIVWLWIQNVSLRELMKRACVTMHTAADWTNWIRKTVFKKFINLPMMGDETIKFRNGYPLSVYQITENILSVKRPSKRKKKQDEEENLSTSSGTQPNENEFELPRVFGIAHCVLNEHNKYTTVEIRPFMVKDHKPETMLNVLRQNVIAGNHVLTDHWDIFKSRDVDNELFYYPIDPQMNSSNPVTKFMTRSVDRAWNTWKNECIKKQSLDCPSTVQFHLAEFWWRSKVFPLSLFEKYDTFLDMAAEVHPVAGEEH